MDNDRVRYDFEIDLGSESTHARVVSLVGSDRRVLELGPATGYMTRVLRERGCTVVGIEIDPTSAEQAAQYCERIIVGDLEALDLEAELGSDRFDVIVAADVLEHLKDPLAALQTLKRFLLPGGFFVLSLPNVAHGSVRLALMAGHFRYQKLGLLDDTHLRFFTRESVSELLDEAELGAAEMFDQELNLDASEVAYDPSVVPPELISRLERDRDARAYQFVIKAVPFEEHDLREMRRRFRELASENARLRDTETQLRKLQESFAAISAREGQLRSSLIDAHEQLLARDEQLDRMRKVLAPVRAVRDLIRGILPGPLYRMLLRIASAALGQR